MIAWPGFFLAPFPDETLHSLISRYCRLTGFASARHVFSDVERSSAFTRNTAFPCHLEKLENVLKPVTGLDADLLISRHTLLPYFKPFLSPEQLTLAIAHMKKANGQGLKMRLGLISSALESHVGVRFCPECLVADDLCHGQAYWHRIHQLPGVWVCPHHAQPLCIVEPTWIRQKAQKCYLPDDDDIQAHTFPLEVDSLQKKALNHLAILSWYELCADSIPLQADTLRENLLRGALCREILNSGGRLQLKPLTEMLLAYFQQMPSAGEFLRLCPINSTQPPSWVLKLLRKPRRTHHPLKYLILADALGLNFEDLSAKSTPAEPPFRHSIDTAKIDTDVIVQRLKEMHSQGCSLRQVAVVTGVSVSTLHVKAVQQGLMVRARPSILLPPVKAKIRGQLIAGKAIPDIARDCGVSLPSVYRVLRIEPGLKDRLFQLRLEEDKKNRRLRFKKERRISAANACTDYAWLYRNDRIWLNGEIIRVGRMACKRTMVINWPELDQALSTKIRKCVAELKVRPGKPILISRALIGRELDATTLFEKKLFRLPRCALELKAGRESHEQFQYRRIKWAAEELEALGGVFGAARLLRYATIRRPRGQAASYLDEYFNRASAKC